MPTGILSHAGIDLIPNTRFLQGLHQALVHGDRPLGAQHDIITALMIFHAKIQVTPIVTLKTQIRFQEIHMTQVIIPQLDNQILEHFALRVLEQIY